MKKMSFFNKILYVINPQKSLEDFLNEAENIVLNYEKSPLDSIIFGGGINVCNKSKSKVAKKRPNTLMYMMVFSVLFAGMYVIFKYI